MDERLRYLLQKFEATPSIQNLQVYLNYARRVGQFPRRIELFNLIYPIIGVLAAEISDEIKVAVTGNEMEFVQSLIQGDLPWILRDRAYEMVGPIYEICVVEPGGIAIGAAFWRLTLDAYHQLYLIQNPQCIYHVDQKIDYLNIRIIDIFDSVGWGRRSNLQFLLTDRG